MDTDDQLQDQAELLDRSEVERIVYQAIGQQFRLPALFSMVLLVVGFVLGHYVASRQTRDVTDRLEERLALLDQQLTTVRSDVAAVARRASRSGAGMTAIGAAQQRLDETPAPPPEPDLVRPETPLGPVSLGSIEDGSAHPFVAVRASEPPLFRLSGMQSIEAQRDEDVFLPGRWSTPPRKADEDSLGELRAEVEEERSACFEELAPYLERRLTVSAEVVARVLDELYDAQDRRLRILAAGNGASGDDFRSDAERTLNKFPPETAESTPAGGSGRAKSQDAGADRRFFPKPRSSGPIYFPASRPATAQTGSAAASR
ncbi:MAG: hypothetical protein KF774_08805 [Planctomyces sp.]|nr:hypothetical protein [Planctomyces sp.]